MWWIYERTNDDATKQWTWTTTHTHKRNTSECSNEWMRRYKIITDRFAREKSDEWCVVFHFRETWGERNAHYSDTHTDTHLPKTAKLTHFSHFFCRFSVTTFFRSPSFNVIYCSWNENASASAITSQRILRKVKRLVFTRKIDNNLMTFNYVEFFIFTSDIWCSHSALLP